MTFGKKKGEERGRNGDEGSRLLGPEEKKPVLGGLQGKVLEEGSRKIAEGVASLANEDTQGKRKYDSVV